MNIERPTLNIEHRSEEASPVFILCPSTFHVGSSMFDVRCSMFPPSSLITDPFFNFFNFIIMIPINQPLEDFVEGHTWGGIPAIVIRVNGSPPASALASVTMRFKKVGSEVTPVVELSSAVAGQITITSAANWEFTIPKQLVPGLTDGRWSWMITCLDVAATPNKDPYLKGEFVVAPAI
jgi:hypothetical protein